MKNFAIFAYEIVLGIKLRNSKESNWSHSEHIVCTQIIYGSRRSNNKEDLLIAQNQRTDGNVSSDGITWWRLSWMLSSFCCILNGASYQSIEKTFDLPLCLFNRTGLYEVINRKESVVRANSSQLKLVTCQWRDHSQNSWGYHKAQKHVLAIFKSINVKWG